MARQNRTLADAIVQSSAFCSPPLQWMVVEALPQLREALAGNAALSKDIWFEMYPAKRPPRADLVELLIDRKLDLDQVDHVVAAEKRASIVASLVLGNGPFDPERTARVVDGPAFGNAVAAAVLAVGVRHDDGTASVPAALYERLVRGLGGVRLLDWLASGWGTGAVGDAELVELLGRYRDWADRHKKASTQAMSVLLGCRPAAVPVAVAAAAGGDLTMRYAVADCRHLTDPAAQYAVAGIEPGGAALTDAQAREAKFWLMKLAHSPVANLAVVTDIAASVEKTEGMAGLDLRASLRQRLANHPNPVDRPFEEVSDESQLEWLLKRTLPPRTEYADYETGEYRRPKVRWYDLPALVVNPHLTTPLVEAVATRLMMHQLTSWPAKVVEDLERLFAAHDVAGPPLSVDEDDVAHDVVVNRPNFGHPTAYELNQLDPALVARVASWPVTSLNQGSAARVVAYATDRIGDNPAAWQTLLSMVDEFAGTVGELVELVELL